jgi:CBS domain-containing protein
MEKKKVTRAARKSTKRVKELTCEEPKPLQAECTVQEAGETMRSLQTERFPVAAGDHLVGTVEGPYPERKAAGYGHDPETTIVRNSMVKKIYYCFEHQSLEEARDIMRRNHLQHLPVVDENLRIVGIVRLDEVEQQQRAEANA